MDVVERRFYKSRSTLSIIAAGLGHSAPVLRAAWVPVFAFIPQHIAESRSVPLPSDPPYTCISALQSPSSEISKEPSTSSLEEGFPSSLGNCFSLATQRAKIQTHRLRLDNSVIL